MCPACRSAVEERDQGFGCRRCGREYPILFGIPDFRLRGDRYLSLEDERAKAGKLHDFARAQELPLRSQHLICDMSEEDELTARGAHPAASS